MGRSCTEQPSIAWLSYRRIRVVGSAKVVKGKIKEAVGDAKLESEGKADKIEGKVQNAVGDLKDAIKGK